VKLFGELPSGKEGKKKTKQVGKSWLSIAEGNSKTVKVKITNGEARKLLRKGQIVKGELRGSGIKNRIVKLKQQGGGKKRKAKRHGRARGSLSSASRVR